MKYILEFHYVKSDHILASPEFDHKEFIETDSPKRLEAYIMSQKDPWGNPFNKDKSFGFDYISNQGGIKVKEYTPPRFKHL